ncbi:unnamed protein product [Bursaphelenchus okinawaensis]|uniref:Uncharacterized protein n=1 Tax=Bursaphelenchus okinawaensis TaxID=465554 RepID=A0A811JTE2_9BILA|nr:unnamed protein product [Bursaphelenchus okinawaensis]CAG9082912.1 unnamed protein product [Bursaphelenchus okinawaensis]
MVKKKVANKGKVLQLKKNHLPDVEMNRYEIRFVFYVREDEYNDDAIEEEAINLLTQELFSQIEVFKSGEDQEQSQESEQRDCGGYLKEDPPENDNTSLTNRLNKALDQWISEKKSRELALHNNESDVKRRLYNFSRYSDDQADIYNDYYYGKAGIYDVRGGRYDDVTQDNTTACLTMPVREKFDNLMANGRIVTQNLIGQSVTDDFIRQNVNYEKSDDEDDSEDTLVDETCKQSCCSKCDLYDELYPNASDASELGKNTNTSQILSDPSLILQSNKMPSAGSQFLPGSNKLASQFNRVLMESREVPPESSQFILDSSEAHLQFCRPLKVVKSTGSSQSSYPCSQCIYEGYNDDCGSTEGCSTKDRRYGIFENSDVKQCDIDSCNSECCKVQDYIFKDGYVEDCSVEDISDSVLEMMKMIRGSNYRNEWTERVERLKSEESAEKKQFRRESLEEEEESDNPFLAASESSFDQLSKSDLATVDYSDFTVESSQSNWNRMAAGCDWIHLEAPDSEGEEFKDCHDYFTQPLHSLSTST